MSIPPRHKHSGQSLFSGGGPGGERRRGLWDGGRVALHGPSHDQPLPSRPAGGLRPLLPVGHVSAVCHLRTPGTARLIPT